MENKFLTLDKIDCYIKSYHLSNYIWDIVIQWEIFEKRTIGQQMVRSADSISANIAEGFGRYHKKDKIKFYRYSFGSMEETKDWIRKCIHRNLITKEEKEYILNQLEHLPRSIHQLIKFTNEKLKY